MDSQRQNPGLSDDQKAVLFDKATEPPFSGRLLHNSANGMYTCANCGNEVFGSGTKFDSGSGWPSFYEPLSSGAVKLRPDNDHGMRRTEVICGRCGAHLGHVFDDAPDQPTGQRFCINSLSLDFKEAGDDNRNK